MPLDATEWITHVPVIESHGRLYALGVSLWLDPPCRIPERLYVRIDEALNAKAAASGSNMPVGLDPDVRLLRCKRCQAPFIDRPHMRLCSAACRMEAKRDAALKSKTKRAGRHESRDQSDRRGRFVCDQCGKRRQATRRTKRFCSLRCRVAAHRGVPAQPPEPMTLEELDREIYDTQTMLGAAECGYLDRATLKTVIERALALQAERAKLVSAPAQAAPSRPDNSATIPETALQADIA